MGAELPFHAPAPEKRIHERASHPAGYQPGINRIKHGSRRSLPAQSREADAQPAAGLPQRLGITLIVPAWIAQFGIE